MKLESQVAMGDILCYHNPFGSMVFMLLLMIASTGASFAINMAGDPVTAFVMPMTFVTSMLSFCAVLRATRVQTTMYVSKVVACMMATNPAAHAAVKQPDAKRRGEILGRLRLIHAGHGLMVLLAVCAVIAVFMLGIGVPELVKQPTLYVVMIGMVNVIVVNVVLRCYLIPNEALSFFHMYTAETDPIQIGVLPS